MAAFDEVCVYARRAGLLVIADGKRGDIGSTARAYADAYLEGDEPRADALTVNPYLGRESVEPYLAAARRSGTGIFVVVKTSNAGGDVQDLTLCATGGRSGITSPRSSPSGARSSSARSASRRSAPSSVRPIRVRSPRRALMPQAILLLPGIGAQGGAVSDLARAFTSGPASALVAASRSVNYAFRETGGDYREAAGAEAARLKKEIWAASGW